MHILTDAYLLLSEDYNISIDFCF